MLVGLGSNGGGAADVPAESVPKRSAPVVPRASTPALRRFFAPRTAGSAAAATGGSGALPGDSRLSSPRLSAGPELRRGRHGLRARLGRAPVAGVETEAAAGEHPARQLHVPSERSRGPDDRRDCLLAREAAARRVGAAGGRVRTTRPAPTVSQPSATRRSGHDMSREDPRNRDFNRPLRVDRDQSFRRRCRRPALSRNPGGARASRLTGRTPGGRGLHTAEHPVFGGASKWGPRVAAQPVARGAGCGTIR